MAAGWQRATAERRRGDSFSWLDLWPIADHGAVGCHTPDIDVKAVIFPALLVVMIRITPAIDQTGRMVDPDDAEFIRDEELLQIVGIIRVFDSISIAYLCENFCLN